MGRTPIMHPTRADDLPPVSARASAVFYGAWPLNTFS